MTKRILPLAMIASAMLALLPGCNPNNNDVFVQHYVLQGQMFVGQAPQIRITHTIPVEQSYDSSQVGVSGAVVDLTAGERTLRLAEVVGDPRGAGYYGLATGDTHTVTPGLRYAIRAAVGSDTITAETRAAGFLNITHQNLDTIMMGIQEVVLRWPADTLARGYWSVIENLNPYRADDSTLLNNNNGGPDKREGVYTQYWSIPPSQDSLQAPWILFNRDGLHRVRVYSCDNALWFYTATMQPGVIENYPISNVNGALGMFTVGGVDTAYFYMRKNPDLHGGNGG
jgi:hypothetical protein